MRQNKQFRVFVVYDTQEQCYWTGAYPKVAWCSSGAAKNAVKFHEYGFGKFEDQDRFVVQEITPEIGDNDG